MLPHDQGLGHFLIDSVATVYHIFYPAARSSKSNRAPFLLFFPKTIFTTSTACSLQKYSNFQLCTEFCQTANEIIIVSIRLSTSTCMEQYGTRTYWCGRCSTSFRPVPGGAVRPSWYRFNRYRNSTEEGLLPEAPREAYFCSSTPNTSMYLLLDPTANTTNM